MSRNGVNITRRLTLQPLLCPSRIQCPTRVSPAGDLCTRSNAQAAIVRTLAPTVVLRWRFILS